MLAHIGNPLGYFTENIQYKHILKYCEDYCTDVDDYAREFYMKNMSSCSSWN